jgi:hypothetical protein
MGVFGERRGTRLRAPVIVSMSPPGYPSAMVASLQCLLPFRLARSLYSGSGPTDAPPRAPDAAAQPFGSAALAKKIANTGEAGPAKIQSVR